MQYFDDLEDLMLTMEKVEDLSNGYIATRVVFEVLFFFFIWVNETFIGTGKFRNFQVVLDIRVPRSYSTDLPNKIITSKLSVERNDFEFRCDRKWREYVVKPFAG